jgi:hypothetical protein
MPTTINGTTGVSQVQDGTVIDAKLSLAANSEPIKTALNASGSAPIYACRAWVNFDGTTSPGTIRASGNVSSVSRLGTGNFRVNFTTAMPDANYATVGSAGGSTTAANTSRVVSTLNAGRLVGSVEIDVHTQNANVPSSASENSGNINVAIFR